MTEDNEPPAAATPNTAANQNPIKVLHLVSGQNANPVVSGMLLPLLLRGDRRVVQKQVVHFSVGSPHAAVTRQAGIPVHELKLSGDRWSLLAPRELLAIVQAFKPDVLHAWGTTAQVAAGLLARIAAWKPKQVWSLTSTEPFAIDSARARLGRKGWSRLATNADRLVYASQSSRARHERSGFSGEHSAVIAPGVDTERYKPDFAARKRVREKLELPANAFVIGMHAPFQTEYDHVTFFSAAGDLIRANPHLQILLAGRGLQRGNAPLMALVGGGTLATRVRLLGEWSDTAGLFSACDVVCSTALTDDLRLNLAMAMLCGVPCVATGPGAQGELLGNFGVSVEPASPAAVVRGITRIMEMPAERRAFIARGARQHALTRFNQLRSIEQYHLLYRDPGAIMASPPEAGAATSLAAATGGSVSVKKARSPVLNEPLPN